MKRLLVYVVAAAMVFTVFGFNPTEASAAVGHKKIAKVGASSRTVNKGAEFELKVRLGSGIGENSVKWTIANTTVVGYDDDDRYDNEMEFYVKKAGTTKIYAKNLKSGKSLVYTVKVKQPASYYISRVGSSTKVIEVGDDEDLRVSKGAALSSSKIKWSIANSKILRFEDGDNSGTIAQVEGIKAGTTKVYAKNLHTGKSLAFTVKVVPDYDD